MGMTLSYSILFEVNVLHHFLLNRGQQNFAAMNLDEQAAMMLLYDSGSIFQIVPSARSRADLDRHNCLVRQTATGLIVGMKAQADSGPPKSYTPSQTLDDDLVFTFYLHLRDFNLLNFTALPLTGNTGRIYLFQNLTGGHGKTFPSLAAHPPLYAAGRTYLPGDMVVDDAITPSTLHIARVKTIAAPTGSADWLTESAAEGLPMSYVGENDRYPLVRQQLYYRVKTAEVEPEIEITNAFGKLIEAKRQILPGGHRTIQIDLRGLPEGLYSLHAHTADLSYQDDLQFYLLQQQETPFAILELAVKSAVTAYDMLDAQGRLRSPVYELRFRNRATHWRYVGKQFNASSVTTTPMPLTRFGVIDNISVLDKSGTPVDDLPGPEVTMIKAEALAVEAEKKFYSEIHIN